MALTLLQVALPMTQTKDMEAGSDTKCYEPDQYTKSPRTDGMCQIKPYNYLEP